MKLERVKLIVGFIIAFGALIGTVLTVDNYFAKSEDVTAIELEHKELEIRDELVQERLDISITDDQIFQQQQQIQQMKNFHIFEQKAEIPELTPMEEEAMKNAEERLVDLKRVKTTKIKKYEAMKK